MLKLSKKWIDDLVAQPESGMGYTVVTIVLRDGRHFNHCVLDSGYISRIRGRNDIPFTDQGIDSVVVTHDKWDFAKD